MSAPRRIAMTYDPIFLRHRPEGAHPENPDRLRSIISRLERSPAQEAIAKIAPRDAEDEELARVHTPEHIRKIVESAGGAPSHFDADTYYNGDSHAAARKAAGGCLEVVRRVADRELDTGIALVRPPGHHAEADHPMGFCLFNNVAVAAEFLRAEYGYKRIAIVDFDVHHGNGTQHSFFDRRDVLYVSTHQFPYYPGTGSLREVGRGDGAGYTLNLPLSGGADDEVYQTVFSKVIIPVLDEYAPEFLLISAGYDAHASDPLAGMGLTSRGYGVLTRMLFEVAERHAGGRCAAVLEGGYNLNALAESVEETIKVLAGIEDPVAHEPNERVVQQLHPVFATYKDFWPVLG